MTQAEILTVLKIDLQLSTTDLDSYLTLLISTAEKQIETEGIVLDSTLVSDCILVEMYAAYLYRTRRGEVKYGEAGRMPRPLRWALNNRLMQQKGAVSDG